MAAPLVSIGIPTYNRAVSLERAIASARAQTHERLEIVVADNASTDATASLCSAVARGDARIRVIRRPRNLGATANFNGVVEACCGEFILLLADDDWLARDYVERCLEVLLARPGTAIACGRTQYFLGDGPGHPGVRTDVHARDPSDRVVGYFAGVGDNGCFYGLMPAHVGRLVFPMANVVGGDWLVVAAAAWLGEIRTVPETTLSRSLAGASSSMEGMAELVGLPSIAAHNGHLVIACEVLAEIGWRSGLYARLGRAGRLRLALRCQPPLLRHWALYRYGRVLAHPILRRARPVTRLRAIRSALARLLVRR